jgi:glucose-6-phosphate 1-dehydrogenase
VSAVQAPNPLVEGLERLPVHPTTLTIFGATGDLAQRKLLPALYNLAHEGSLPERFNLIAFSRREQGHEDYRQLAREAIGEHSRTEPDPKVLDALLERVSYIPGSFDDDDPYRVLEAKLDELDQEADLPLNRVFYLSTAPTFFPVIVTELGRRALDEHDGAEVRVVIEKPFGADLVSAQELNRRVLSVFAAPSTFRMDH